MRFSNLSLLICRAKEVLDWEPRVPLEKGLQKTIDYFRRELQRSRHSERNLAHPREYWIEYDDQGGKEIKMEKEEDNKV